MSPGNIERALWVYELFNERDFDRFLEMMAEDVVIQSRIIAIEGGLHGHEGTRRWWNDFLEVFPDYRLEIEDPRELGDFTLAKASATAHGALSDSPVIDALWHVAGWRDGRIFWWRVCASEEEALEAIAARRQA